MLVAIILATAVILGGMIVVGMGRGGELARERPDAPASADFRTWSDVAQYRPPAALLGYHARTTEHALSLIARTVAERDAEIEWLRQRLAEARPGLAPYDPDEARPGLAPYGPDEARPGLAPYDAEEAGSTVAAGAATDDHAPGEQAFDEHAGLAHDAMRASEPSFGGRIGEDE